MPKFNLFSKYASLWSYFESGKKKQRAEQLPPLPRSRKLLDKWVNERWAILSNKTDREQLLDTTTEANMMCYKNNIEHFIGTVKIPVGIAGPLTINGDHAHGDYYIPLATTEAALVASYHRGALLCQKAGGVTTAIIDEGVTRTPCFAFATVKDAKTFVSWLSDQYEKFNTLVTESSRFAKLKDIHPHIEANYVYVVCEFLTGDASGQNMVTFATDAIYRYILAHMPTTPTAAFLDGNLSGDKKPNHHTLRSVRGKKIVAEVVIPSHLVAKQLHTTVDKMLTFSDMTSLGAKLSGAIGINAHFANALAALYIACGQDAACVAESAVGVTRFSKTHDGDLYASVTLPNIMVGTVGGGTHLPSQKACLDILGLAGPGHAHTLAEVVAATCLAGELSIVGAFCAEHFSRAHNKLARQTHS